MKKVLFLLPAFLLCLLLFACRDPQATPVPYPENAAESTVPVRSMAHTDLEEVLTGQVWQIVSDNIGVKLSFQKDNTGTLELNGKRYSITWFLAGDVVHYAYSFAGTAYHIPLSLTEESGFLLLKTSDGQTVYAQQSQLQAALAVYENRE